LHPRQLSEVEREEVEEERSVGLRLHRDHAASIRLGDAVVDLLEIRRLAAQSRAVIDDLRVDLAPRIADNDHGVAPELNWTSLGVGFGRRGGSGVSRRGREMQLMCQMAGYDPREGRGRLAASRCPGAGWVRPGGEPVVR